jgi:5S rRNA maturation endonuclease (ribonuclease M5)
MAVVVEGTLDVLRAWDAGYGFCVATLGGPLSDAQASLLKQYVAEVFLAFDNDQPGKDGIIRGQLFTEISLARLAVVEMRGRKVILPKHRKDIGDCMNDELDQVLGPVRSAILSSH